MWYNLCLLTCTVFLLIILDLLYPPKHYPSLHFAVEILFCTASVGAYFWDIARSCPGSFGGILFGVLKATLFLYLRRDIIVSHRCPSYPDSSYCPLAEFFNGEYSSFLQSYLPTSNSCGNRCTHERRAKYLEDEITTLRNTLIEINNEELALKKNLNGLMADTKVMAEEAITKREEIIVELQGMLTESLA